MMKLIDGSRKIIPVFLAAAVLAAAVSACGEKPSMSAVPNDETGGIDVTADRIYGSTGSGNITIGEGQCLVISPMLEKGHFIVSLTPEADFNGAMEEDTEKTLDEGVESVLKEKIEGKVMSAYAVDPGDYYVFITSEEEKTTGTMSIMPYDIEALRAENEALAEALGEDFVNSVGGLAGEDIYEEEDGQNPVMNFVGPYVCDRSTVKIEADGMEGAKITVDWPGSAFENTEWVMSGTFDPETLTIEYTDCVMTDILVNEDGEEESRAAVYENGTGRIIFREGTPLTLTWEDDEEHAADDMEYTFDGGRLQVTP